MTPPRPQGEATGAVRTDDPGSPQPPPEVAQLEQKWNCFLDAKRLFESILPGGSSMMFDVHYSHEPAVVDKILRPLEQAEKVQQVMACHSMSHSGSQLGMRSVRVKLADAQPLLSKHALSEAVAHAPRDALQH